MVRGVPRVVVLGQVGRDLVLRVPELPHAGGSVPVHRRIEILGGKGANQAVGLTQLGAAVTLVGVVGDDEAGTSVLEQARRDGIDLRVVRRSGATTALLVDVVEDGGRRRLLEHVPHEVLLTAEDVAGVADAIRSAPTLVVQLQQPTDAVLAALRIPGPPDRLVVVDGAPQDPDATSDVLAAADVVRADASEARQLLARSLDDVGAVVDAAHQLLRRGPRVVALDAGAAGNVVAWPGGHVVMPLLPVDRVDPTGGGDAFVAALTVRLASGDDPEGAAWWASAASALCVSRLGGRPALRRDDVAELSREARAGRGG